CRVCAGWFVELEGWGGRARGALEGLEFESFLVGTRPGGLVAENEEVLWSRFGALWAEPFKQEVNREVGRRLLEALGPGVRVEFVRPDVVVLLDVERGRVLVEVHSLFLSGRYRKLARGLPQTRWPCRECGGRGCVRCGFTGKMYAESVEELLRGPVVEAFRARDGVLHGAGREDIDARMLGGGRPFLLEVVEPRVRHADLGRLMEAIRASSGGRVEVEGLAYGRPGDVAVLKAARPDKRYRARLRLGAPVEEGALRGALGGLVGTIRQRTPTRVSHRRADKVRERRVHHIVLQLPTGEGPRVWEVEVFCEGGLYVKELFSGDGGRTEPSLSGLLGVAAEVESLDVLEVGESPASAGQKSPENG
ncbi:MAG: tRNA pseudouridine(54/55) synthase Pus10, partial [Euryarchaeota archaeon]|nr:tRNA pseudouridine(54/55) synthase Pus10 [Euryarchaeota archaeon]